MATVRTNLGNVKGPKGDKGDTGDSYVLTSSDKTEIAGIVGTDNYLPKSMLYVDVYDSTASQYPTLITYATATVTVKNTEGTTLYTANNLHGRLAIPLAPYQEVTISATANGYETMADQTAVVVPEGVTKGFAAVPTTTVYYDVLWKVDGVTVQADRVLPHASSTYSGATPASSGKLWTGWDGNASDVVANMVINATFLTPVLPAEPAVVSDFDYAYTDVSGYTSAYTLAEIMGIMLNAQDISTYLAVGNRIRIATPSSTITDDSLTFMCHKIGGHHYKYSDLSGWARISWHMDCLMNGKHNMNNSGTNAGGWKQSAMRSWLNSTILGAMPQIWQSVFASVRIWSSTGLTAVTVDYSDDKLYLLSNAEVGFFTTTTPYMEEVESGNDGVQFSIYTSNNARIKKYYNGTGSGDIYWSRSPNAGSSSYFQYVTGSGTSNNSHASSAYGVAFGFSV